MDPPPLPYVVHSPPGNPHALLPSVFSSLVSLPISFVISVPPAEKSSKKSEVPVASPLFGSAGFVFSGPDGLVLQEPTAVVRFLAEVYGSEEVKKLVPEVSSASYFEVEQWLEWEERVLRASVRDSLASEKGLAPALASKLETAIQRSGFLVGDHLTVADVAVWSSLFVLLGVAEDSSSPPSLNKWFTKLQGDPKFQEGVSRVAGSAGPNALRAAALAEHVASLKISSVGRPKLPIPGRRNILVTSALPYVNNVPHLGNIIGCVLSADVYARFCRMRGHNTIYMCGTDEYGTATETKALEEGLTPREICDKYHAIHRSIYDWFEISFDKFGRTSTPEQTEIAQSIFLSLLKEGRLIEDSMKQPFCETCKRFLADRFVKGECPTPGCGYDDARGDQCDKCGKLLNAADLINPKCHICGSRPMIKTTDHLFLDLPALKGQLEEYVAKTSVAGGWSANSVQVTGAWIRDGLKPRCITRDLKWGVPVPLEKFKDKVFYVWFDAPIGYISITANYCAEWEQWWKNPENVEMVQFMGKDNIPFHTVIFPCTLIGTREAWTLMRTISVTEYLNYENGKFSKSRGVGVFGNEARSTGIPVEVWRYYLLTNRPEVSDTNFMWSDLQAKQNNELLKNLGNFIHRTLSFLLKPIGEGYGGVVPDATSSESDPLTKKLGEEVEALVKEYVDSMEKVKLKAGLKTAMAASSLGNAYLQESQFWKLFKEEKSRCDVVLRSSVGLVHLLAVLLLPFMPSFSHKVLLQLNLPEESLSLSDEKDGKALSGRLWDIIPPGHKIGAVEPIFREMKDEEVEALRERFAGSQADRNEAEASSSSSAKPAAAVSGSEKKEVADRKKGEKKGSEKKGAGGGGGVGGKAGGGKSGGGGGGGEKPGANTALDVSRLDIRVGRIVNVKRHPDADTLYVEEIDLAEESGPRTVVSGLVKFVPIEEMQNRLVCVLCNLKPANMRGVKSHAMVLAASNADHSQVELLSPPAGSTPGERIRADGFPGEPDEQLNPKKKIWEAIQVDLKTNAEKVGCYKGTPLITSAGPCSVASLTDASIG